MPREARREKNWEFCMIFRDFWAPMETYMAFEKLEFWARMGTYIKSRFWILKGGGFHSVLLGIAK